MKKLLLIVVLLSFSLGGVILGKSYTNKPSPGSLVVNYGSDSTRPPVVAQEVVKSVAGVPQTLIIPKIGVNSSIELVGEDSLGRMGVPTEVMDVGWYKLGFRPGEKGNAVIDGHLDSPYGPAVFYNLAQLEPGDKIIVNDDRNQTHTFIVSRKEAYLYDQVPLGKVFASADKPYLNLITCGGSFDRSAKNYSQRIVIYSQLETA
ncbi:MAG: class F sortase [Patescibacteria group bacterium]|nr:class F sortase [Patescibacteria group bacterium]